MTSLPAAAKGDRTKVKGYYRFVDQPDEAATTPENILRPHQRAHVAAHTRRANGAVHPRTART